MFVIPNKLINSNLTFNCLNWISIVSNTRSNFSQIMPTRWKNNPVTYTVNSKVHQFTSQRIHKKEKRGRNERKNNVKKLTFFVFVCIFTYFDCLEISRELRQWQGSPWIWLPEKMEENEIMSIRILHSSKWASYIELGIIINYDYCILEHKSDVMMRVYVDYCCICSSAHICIFASCNKYFVSGREGCGWG